MIEKIKEGLQDAISIVQEKVGDSVELIKDFKELSTGKISDLVNNVLGLSPLIEESGFRMGDLNIAIGIPPSVSLGFIKEKDISPEAIDKILEENKDNELLKIILQALLKADSLQKSMNLSHYQFNSVGLTLGLPPDVSLKFIRQG
ncbi:MAG: hypothetical protein C5B52_10730 [Bacteroidetes bacterium]|nr:MAG: hypothetical protein C5B52_10730 [Bacteroidota bacterium]